MLILTETERNLQTLQATIDMLAADLANYDSKRILNKAAVCESLSRLIRIKEQLMFKQGKRDPSAVDRLANYIQRKGQVTYETIRKSGCLIGGAKVIDQALEDLGFLGLLEVVDHKRKGERKYKITRPFTVKPSMQIRMSLQEEKD